MAVLPLLLCLLPLAPASSPPQPASPSPCPRRCRCQTQSLPLSVLCPGAGLLFVPPSLDRRAAELRLADNFIATVRRRDLANMTGLLHLSLSRNTIRHVAAGAFSDLRALRALHLDGNRLTSLGEGQLRGLVNLLLLAGVIGAFAAQGLTPLRAAVLAAYTCVQAAATAHMKADNWRNYPTYRSLQNQTTHRGHAPRHWPHR